MRCGYHAGAEFAGVAKHRWPDAADPRSASSVHPGVVFLCTPV